MKNVLKHSFSWSHSPEKYIANALLVDMEPKVVTKCLTESKKAKTFWEYDKKYSYYKQEGSGNNWAFGHNVHGPKNLEKIADAYSRLLENMDSTPGCFIL